MRSQKSHLEASLARGAAKPFIRCALKMTPAKAHNRRTRLCLTALVLLVVFISVSDCVGARLATAATPEPKALQAEKQPDPAQPTETERLQQRIEHVADQQDELAVWLKGQQGHLATAHQQVQELKQEIAQLEPGNPQAQVLQQRLDQFTAEQAQLETWIQQRIERIKVTRQQIQFLRQGIKEVSDHQSVIQQTSQSEGQRAQSNIIQGTLLEWLKQDIDELEEEHQFTLPTWLQQDASSAPADSDSPGKTSSELPPNPTPPSALTAHIEPKQPVEPKQPAESPPPLLTRLQPEQPAQNNQPESESARLELERELALLDKQLAAETDSPSQVSLAPAGESQMLDDDQSFISDLPSACIAPLQNKIARLEQSNHSSDVWFQEVFECNTCCAPLLDEIMDIHTNHVAAQPHTLVLFDFDTYTLQKRYQQQIDTLLADFNPTTDHLLLIGRASPIGDHAYNVILSGKRAGEIKDYVIENFSVTDAQIRYLYFGYDPPQLTLEHATSYGIKPADLARIDATANTSSENKVNQSVVVIVYRGSKKQS